ncbi:hypothetical protein E4U16_005122 [Claviceps sp. LM84 group G4]|nr:hypothetical protein E4U16_005122 [Claviceps sp. LM84 group G4]
MLDIAEDKVYELQEKPQIWSACDNNESESDNSHHSNEDNVLIPPIDIYDVYGKLGSESPSAFLDHNDCEAFLALNPRLHTPENLVRFEKRMADLKALARELVRPLLRPAQISQKKPRTSHSTGIGALRNWYSNVAETCKLSQDLDACKALGH